MQVDPSFPPVTTRIVVKNDQTTPYPFVVDLIVQVFSIQESEARKLASDAHWHGEATIGWYPVGVAQACVAECKTRIAEAGASLVVTTELGTASDGCCDLCGKPAADPIKVADKSICASCTMSVSQGATNAVSNRQFKYAYEMLQWHFAGYNVDSITTTSRTFPAHMRADIYLAAEEQLMCHAVRFVGVDTSNRYEPLVFSALLKSGNHAKAITPVSFEEIDTGEESPISCPSNGLWLLSHGDLKLAVLIVKNHDFQGGATMLVEIAVPTGDAGAQLVDEIFSSLSDAVAAARSYRGKVISLESGESYSGEATGLRVHRLDKVRREDVILPAETLRVLDRNVAAFAKQRAQLKQLGLPVKKGILLYGPPGTGKTHTIRYLAGALEGHTTLLVTSEQAGLIGEYFKLARLLQPSMMVIEDADLIARSREAMGSACEEVLLNKLLNEMDGLKEDADIFFILTTNRPEQLERALAGRPGRIDQAIEVGLPDKAGRTKLVKLYARGLKIPKTVLGAAVAKTEGVSGAFIKELMRRVAQLVISRGASGEATVADIDEALQDMLFRGGRLNASLLGAGDAIDASS